MQTKVRELYGKYNTSSTLIKVFVSFVVILTIGHVMNPIMSAVYGTPLYYAAIGTYETVSVVCGAIIAKLTLAEMFGGFGAFIAECKKQYSDAKEKITIGKTESAALKEVNLRKVEIARTLEESNSRDPRFKLAFHAATLGGMGGYDAMRGQWGAVVAFPAIQLAYSLAGAPGLILLLIAVVPLAKWSSEIYLSGRPAELSHRVLIDAVVGMILACLVGILLEGLMQWIISGGKPPVSPEQINTSNMPPELKKIYEQNAKELAEAEAEGINIWMWAYWYLLIDHLWRFWPRPQMEAWLAQRYCGVKLLLLDELPPVFGAAMFGILLGLIYFTAQDVHMFINAMF
ncbi:MAG: hypothetical protein J0L97_02725 [Alphaproteobacteria bacterium]|nr:hypothetical protein [Alphaproteobacteria bacterium]